MKALISACIIAAIGILVFYHEWSGVASGVLLLLIWRKICTWYEKNIPHHIGIKNDLRRKNGILK